VFDLVGTILVAGGTGRVGKHAVNFLSRSDSVKRIIIVGRDNLSGSTVLNNTSISAALAGFYPKLEYRSVDLRDGEETLKLLQETQPDVILNAATAMSMFPFHGMKKLNTGAYFIIRDLAILYPFMKALKKSRIKTHVVNVANPDNNHYILSKVGLGQLIGAGTIDLTVQGIKLFLSERLMVAMNKINVLMISHVAIRSHPPKRQDVKVPYYVKISVEDNDITDKIDVDEVVSEGAWRTFHVYNKTNAMMTAASAVSNILAIINDTREVRHGAGVDGMVGGTPVHLSLEGAKTILPDRMTREEAFKLNSVGMNIMGIEKVRNDGTIVFTDKSLKELETALSLSWKEVKLRETVELADIYVNAYRKMIKRLNP
jgi:hypothetical protein